MKLPSVCLLAVGTALLITAIGCSTSPAEVAPTPNIDATVDARVEQERAVDATVEARAKELVAAQPTATPYPTYTPVPTATPVSTATPTPVPTPMPEPIEYSYIQMQCRPIVSDIAKFALETAYDYSSSGNWRLINLVGTEGKCGFTLDIKFIVAAFESGQLNLDLGWPVQGIAGIQKELFDNGHPYCWPGQNICSVGEIQESEYPFNIMGYLTDGVVKVRASEEQKLTFPEFLYEMTFSEKTLTELHNSGMEGEELARHYYKNYEAEWTTWFKGKESEQIKKLRTAVTVSTSVPSATPTPTEVPTPVPTAKPTPVPTPTPAPVPMAEIALNKGVDFGAQGLWEQAIEQFDKAIALDPSLAMAYVNRSLVYINLGEHQRAIQDTDKAIELDPSIAIAYVNRSAAYLNLGQYQRAIQDADKAIELDPSIAIAYVNRSGAYSNLGQYQRAIQDADKAIELDPSIAMAYVNRSGAYTNLGQLEHLTNLPK